MSDHGYVCGCGAKAVEDLIKTGFKVDISKALDPLDPDDYIVIVARLSRAMSRATRATEVEILKKAMDVLDVDWPNLSLEQRKAVAAAARAALVPLPTAVIPPVTGKLEIAGPRIMRGTRRSVRAAASVSVRTEIGISLALRDKAILEYLTSSQALFITDEYARRRERYSIIARSTVEEGLKDGLGRDAIAAQLQERLGPVAGLRQSRQYWSVIAGTFSNRSRVFSALSSFDEAGITQYVFEAILDEATTDQCAFLHGRTFNVREGIKRFEQSAAAEDPQDVKDIQPWVRTGRDEAGNRILFTQSRAGERQLVAQVDKSRVGTVDNTGSFSRGMSTSQLQAAGISQPPLHPMCRSTIIPDI